MIATLETVKYPANILRRHSREVSGITKEIEVLADDMLKTMILEYGVGIAAPQVNVSRRVIIVDMGKDSRVFVNPIIVKKSKDTEVMDEGCLSVPGIFRKVKRAKSVWIKALDLNGKGVNIKVDGFVARIFQHEVDHLNGILFINRVSFLDKINITKELFNLKKKYKKQ